MKLRSMAVCAAAFLIGIGPASLAQDTDIRAVLTAPIGIERAEAVTAVPLEVRMGKLFMDAAINGEVREFIFDTGSPTILTRAFADALGLEAIGQNTGVDANGNAVTMDIAVVDRVTIGSTVFSDVPVFIYDYAGVDVASCILDGGVLGSELLPGSVWQIDTRAAVLRIADSVDRFGNTDPEVSARLYDFGYPHAPIVDYGLGNLADKALFDTGNSDEVTLFQQVAESPDVERAIVSGTLRRGQGSEGVSAGGHGEFGDLVRFSLDGFEIDGDPLGIVRAATRGVPPSLMGAGLLARYIVTLDYPGEAFLMDLRNDIEAARPEAGYAISFVREAATVVQMFDGSPAAEAGLQLGDQVTSAQGRSLAVTPANPLCESALWLMEDFDRTEAADLEILRDGAAQTIHIPAAQN